MDKDFAHDYSEEGIRFLLDSYRELASLDGIREPVRDFMLDVTEALYKSKYITERQAEVVRLRYMAHVDTDDYVTYTAEQLGISPRTVQYDSTNAIKEIYIYLNGVRG